MTGREPCDECGVMTDYNVGRTLCSDCRGAYAFEEGETYEAELGAFEVVEISNGEVLVRFSDEYATTYDAEELDEKVRKGEVVVA